jgi:hypothetical protein
MKLLKQRRGPSTNPRKAECGGGKDKGGMVNGKAL